MPTLIIPRAECRRILHERGNEVEAACTLGNIATAKANYRFDTIQLISMKLCTAQIENFKSLRKVRELERLGDLTVFVGSNSSGKSNILEALNLFFSQFQAVSGTTSDLAAHLWHGKVTTRSITFTMTIELDDSECNDILTPAVLERLKKKSADSYSTLVVERKILNQTGSWRTELLKLGDITLVKADIETPDKSFFEALGMKLAYEVHFFTKDNSAENIGGEMLLVDPEKKAGYHTDDRINQFVKAGVIPSSTKTWGQNLTKWAQENGFKLLGRPPTPQEVETPPGIHQTLKSLTELLKKGFRLIPNVRGNASIEITKRTPQVPNESLQRIRKIWESGDPKDDRILSKFKKDLGGSFPGVLEFRTDSVDVEVSDTRIPIEYLGGGHQERLSLQERLLDDGIIYGLEEPEIHQHPQSARDLFEYLKRESKKADIRDDAFTDLCRSE